MSDFSISETERRGASAIRRGRVVRVDAGTGRAAVSFGGETESADLPVMAPRAGSARVWSMPQVGEQVWVLAEGGETAAGVILGGAFSEGAPAPSSEGEGFEVFVGDSQVSILPARILLSVGGSSIEIDAGGIRINAPRVDIN